MANYYCHECNQRVSVNSALQCENCRGEFVEEMAADAEEELNEEEAGHPHRGMYYVQRDGDEGGGRTIIIEGANPFESMLQSNSPFGRLFGQIMSQQIAGGRSAPSSSQPRSASAPAEEEPSAGRGQDTGVMQFFNQLMANLAETDGGGGNTRLTFHINQPADGGGGGPGGFFQSLHGNLNDYAWGEGGIDHIVTQLLNQFEGGREECIRAEDLYRLPMTEVTDKQVENGTQCATCMEVFAQGERVAQLDCQHIFHRPCIEPWLKKRNTCPICRQVVEPKNWGPEPKISDIDELD